MAPRPPWVPAWDDLPPDRTAGGGPVHGVLRRLPVLHRRPAGPGARVPRADRRPRRHPGHPGLGQRRQLGGWSSNGSINDNRLQNFDPAGAGRAGPAYRRAGRPERPQQLPVGMDHGRQHPLQAVEARGPRGRGGRPVHRELAGPARVGRWGPPPVHPRRRHPSHRARAGRHRGSPTPSSTCRRPGRRHQLRLHRWARRCRRPAPPHHAALRDVREPGHLPRRLEGGHLQAHRAALRRRPQLERAVQRGSLGALPRGRGSDRDPRSGRAASPTGWPTMVDRWWAEARAQPGPPPRQPGPAHAGQSQARPAAPRA